MTDEVLDNIVREVLAAIQSRGLGAALPAPQAVAAAAAKPAPRTPDRPGAAAPQAQPKAPPAGARPADTRKIFLTADMLRQRLAGESGQTRTIDLAHNEFLTPAAIDLADDLHLAVRRQQPMQLAPPVRSDAVRRCGPEDALTGTLQTSAALGLVVRKPNELVRGVLDGLARDKITAFDFNRTDCWIVNTRALCDAVVSGSVSGGVVMVPQATDAVVLANKVRGIRAVQGIRPESLALAMARLAPNVLVLEHSTATFHEVRAMLRMFAGPRAAKGQDEVVIDAIEKLERA